MFSLIDGKSRLYRFGERNTPPHAILSSNCRRQGQDIPFAGKLCLLSEYVKNFRNRGYLNIKNTPNFIFQMLVLTFNVLLEFDVRSQNSVVYILLF